VAEISAAAVKELREKTGAGVMECRRALEQAEGNQARAIEILRQQGLAQVEKRAGRAASQGVIDQYIHGGGRIGVLVEVNCETDFVARNEEFKELAHNIAMQIAAANPKYVSAEDIPAGSEEDPKEVALLSQPYIRDPKQTINDLVTAVAAKFKENVKVRRFARFELGAE
jgi:elongation factor Ts